MARQQAEIQKAYRERQKLKAKDAPDALAYLFDEISDFTFADFVEKDIPVEVAGQGLIDTPASVAAHIDELLKGVANINWRDIETAETAFETMTEAAHSVASLVNAFKMLTIEDAIFRNAKLDLTDPAAKDAALREAVKLDGIKRRLERKTRRDFATTIVKGDIMD